MSFDACRLLRRAAPGLPAVLVAMAILVAPRLARAQRYVVVEERPQRYTTTFNLGFDVEGAADVAPPPIYSGGVEGGGGFKARFGAQIHRRFLRIIPEGGISYTHLWVSDAAGNGLGWNMERVFAGVRVGFGEVIVPVLYGHVGAGWRGATEGSVPNANGFTLDGGVALDFHLIRHFGFGLHAEYVAVEATPYVPDWLAFGAHADIAF